MKKIILDILAFICFLFAAGFAQDFILAFVFVALFALFAFLACYQKKIDHSAGKQGWSI